jgi:hypothetical protein
MRMMSSLAILASVGAGTLMALPGLTGIAWAVQDQPVTIGAVQMVCTGAGSAKDNPAWNAWPVKLTFSNLAGQNEAFEHVVLTQDGRTVMESDCDLPWLLLKAPPGRYDVHASLPGRTASASFTAGSGGQQTVNLAFPSGSGALGARAGSVNLREGPDAASLGERPKQASAMPVSLLPH